MFRRTITNGDLMATYKPWYSLRYAPFRNLSEEVRALDFLLQEAKSKYMKLSNLNTIASKNVGDDLETLQLYLLDNSEAYYETQVDTSILEKRVGVKYKSIRDGYDKNGNQNKGKEKQKKEKENHGKENNSVTLLDVLLKSKYTLH